MTSTRPVPVVVHLRRVTSVKKDRREVAATFCPVIPTSLDRGDPRFTTCVEEVTCKACLASLSHAIIVRMTELGPS